MIRAAALGLTVEDLSVGVLSLAGARPVAVRGAVEVLLVECSPPELEFFARQLEAHLPVRVDKVLLGELVAVTRRPEASRSLACGGHELLSSAAGGALLKGKDVPVIALLAEAHLETLQRLAQFPSGTRVGVASTTVETAHNLEHSIANAGLPNITLVGVCPAEGPSWAVWCGGPTSSSAPPRRPSASGRSRARRLQVMIDDRALDQRAIENARGPPGARRRRQADGRSGPEAAQA